MKKIVLTMVMMTLLGSASQMAQAQQGGDENQKTQTEKSANKYDSIDPVLLPGQISEAINNTYVNCRVDEAYVSSTAFAKYKVKLFTQARKKLMVYMDDRGVILNETKTF